MNNISFKLLKLTIKYHTHNLSTADFIYKVLTNLHSKRGGSLFASSSFEEKGTVEYVGYGGSSRRA